MLGALGVKLPARPLALPCFQQPSRRIAIVGEGKRNCHILRLVGILELGGHPLPGFGHFVGRGHNGLDELGEYTHQCGHRGKQHSRRHGRISSRLTRGDFKAAVLSPGLISTFNVDAELNFGGIASACSSTISPSGEKGFGTIMPFFQTDRISTLLQPTAAQAAPDS